MKKNENLEKILKNLNIEKEKIAFILKEKNKKNLEKQLKFLIRDNYSFFLKKYIPLPYLNTNKIKKDLLENNSLYYYFDKKNHEYYCFILKNYILTLF